MNANTNTPKTAAAPMQGLARWLRVHAKSPSLSPSARELLESWADAVDVALAAPQPEATSTEASYPALPPADHAYNSGTFASLWGEKKLRAFADATVAQRAAQAPTAVRASAMGESRELAWTDDDGTHHSMSVESATKTLAELFKAWPAGLDEIEASVGGWRGRAQNLEEKIAALATAAVQGDAPAHDKVRATVLEAHREAVTAAGWANITALLQDAARMRVALNGANRPVTLDFKQAIEVLEMFGGEPGEVMLSNSTGHSGEGLYAWSSELPEDGAEYLGKSDAEAIPAQVQGDASSVLAPVVTVAAQGDEAWLQDAHSDNAPLGFNSHERGSWSIGYETGYRAALAAASSVQLPSDIVSYVQGIYGFLESVAPPGIAVEAFRLPPSPTRAQAALFDAASSDECSECAGSARQDQSNRLADSGAVATPAPAAPGPAASSAVPKGYALVPLVLTEHMHAAAVRAAINSSGNDDWPPNVWAAMLGAAASPALAPEQSHG